MVACHLSLIESELGLSLRIETEDRITGFTLTQENAQELFEALGRILMEDDSWLEKFINISDESLEGLLDD
jgi:hypothetical protein